jgi:hypothetical protein
MVNKFFSKYLGIIITLIAVVFICIWPVVEKEWGLPDVPVWKVWDERGRLACTNVSISGQDGLGNPLHGGDGMVFYKNDKWISINFTFAPHGAHTLEIIWLYEDTPTVGGGWRLNDYKNELVVLPPDKNQIYSNITINGSDVVSHPRTDVLCCADSIENQVESISFELVNANRPGT